MTTERIHWVDALRGSAIFMMIIFHIFFDLDLLGLYKFDFQSIFWLRFGHLIRIIFLTLVGFSLFLSHKKRQPYNVYRRHQIIRGLKLFLVAMGVTLASYIAFPGDYIRFGVLHFISVGIISGALLFRNTITLIIIMFLSLILGAYFSQIILSTPLLMPFGLLYPGFNSMDYFPIFPWISLIFFGIVFARILDKYNLIANPSWLPRFKFFEAMGRRSLAIYLIHQPVIFGLIWLIFV